MTGKIEREVQRETGTGTDLWRVIAAPIVWALHFLFCYVYGAIYCAKSGRDASLDGPTLVIVIATAVALALIAASTWHLWRVRGRSLTDNDFEFEHNTPEERHRFLSHVALMLCVLSAVAVLYVAIPMLYLTTCR
jgi:uncharacterized membrane protein YbhN (UPF0104 family)